MFDPSNVAHSEHCNAYAIGTLQRLRHRNVGALTPSEPPNAYATSTPTPSEYSNVQALKHRKAACNVPLFPIEGML